MTYDQCWTLFVRAWRHIGKAARDRWVRSPERIRKLLEHYPMPWTIEQDWSWEVMAQDGTIVFTTPRWSDAKAFMDLAEKLAG